jgi:signal transduction histidine kinase
LLDDLLDVSRIARGRIVLQSEPLEIGEFIGPAIEIVQPLMNEKTHELRVQRPGQPLHVHGDRARLVQCLSNLLNNSAKYSAARGEIVLVVAEAPDSVTFEVRDNGPGVSPELLPHIFDLFVQGERSLDRRNASGHGERHKRGHRARLRLQHPTTAHRGARQSGGGLCCPVSAQAPNFGGR